MSILALVPARGGSKRLPGKNTKVLGGKPLIHWSIDAAQALDAVSDVLVSTDDASIAEVARKAGALVPWLRPAELSTDTASVIDVCIHALDWYEATHGKPVEGLLLLQPTSPFRRYETMVRGIALFQEHQRAVVGFSPARTHPLWCFQLEEGGVRPFIDARGLTCRSQDLPPAYEINGSFYLAPPAQLRTLRTLFSDDMLPLIEEEPSVGIDIDTVLDWHVAESMLEALKA